MQLNADTPPESLLFYPASYEDRLDLRAVFPVRRHLEVELGSGDGGFMLDWARRHPERNFIAVERLLGRLRKLDRKGRRAGLANLRLLRIEASYFVRYLLPPASVAAMHIYFPDPWPKRRHKKNRLVSAEFVLSLQQALEPDGAVYVRTDDGDYFEQMRAAFGCCAGFRAVDTPAALRELRTEFEKEFNAQGVPTLHAAYQKR